ncbi:MAG TPA: hypothetical protein VJP77_01945 [Planctomycetota bacterium]|nr:hypothetical protein [Planctomycetota bacterium]
MIRTTIAIAALALPAGAQTYVILDPPCVESGGRFGLSAVVLDFDGDGNLDLAVGAPGQGAVYLFFGPLLTNWIRIRPEGALPPLQCAPTPPPGFQLYVPSFGHALAAGPLDTVPGDELFVGAPEANGTAGEVRVYGQALTPIVLQSGTPVAGAGMGASVAVGDFDGDTELDVAAGAPTTNLGSIACTGGSTAEGRLHIFHSGLAVEAMVDNPLAGVADACNAFWSVDLAVTDANGDGDVELFVSSEANPVGGHPNAGSVHVYPGPVVTGLGVSTPQLVFDDQLQICDDGARYGKSIDARGTQLVVGAPRKDRVPNCSRVDTGGGFLYAAPTYLTGLLTPQPVQVEALLGFRAWLGDRIGDPTPDAVFAVLGASSLWIWDGATPTLPPTVVAGPTGASGHFATGVAAGQLTAGGREELVLGDPDFDGDKGRVAILR